MNKYLKKIITIIKSPSLLVGFTRGLSKGFLYIMYYRFFRNNVKIKFPFFVYGDLLIKGPGSVFIDRGCSVYLSALDHVNIITLSKNAEVRIGKSCTLAGVTVRCNNRVELHDHVMTATNLIQDFMFYSKPDDFDSMPVVIYSNVWLGAQASVLSGSSIGKNSVLSNQAVSFNFEVKKDRLASGNLIKRALPIAKILKLSAITKEIK